MLGNASSLRQRHLQAVLSQSDARQHDSGGDTKGRQNERITSLPASCTSRRGRASLRLDQDCDESGRTGRVHRLRLPADWLSAPRHLSASLHESRRWQDK